MCDKRSVVNIVLNNSEDELLTGRILVDSGATENWSEIRANYGDISH